MRIIYETIDKTGWKEGIEMEMVNLNNKQVGKHTLYISKLLKVLIFITIIVGVFTSTVRKAEASAIAGTSGQVIVKINYLEEVAVVTAATGSSIKFYISTDNKKTWDLVDPSGVVDISGMLQKKESIIYFKGNKETTPTAVTLQAQDSSLKATYQVVGGEGSIILSGTTIPVEYRKGTYGRWKPVSSPIPTTIYEVKGATLYFQTIATTSKRAGAPVSVKISKKPAAPAIKLDGSKLYFTGLKSGETEYRVGDSAIWIPFAPTDTKLKTIDISTLFGMGTQVNTPILAGIVEFRTKATIKKVASSVKIIEVPVQPIFPDTAILNGTTLSIKDTDLKKAYEYVRVEKGATLNIKTAKWVSITASAKPVVLKSTSIGDKIYVRLKSTTDNVSKVITPASTTKELTVITITIIIK